MSRDYHSKGTLSLLLLTYVRPLEEVDAQMEAHVAWLEQGFDVGAFLAAGRRDPRTGGVILARGEPSEVAAAAQTDPFVTSGVATVGVVAFNASFARPEISALLA